MDSFSDRTKNNVTLSFKSPIRVNHTFKLDYQMWKCLIVVSFENLSKHQTTSQLIF